MIREHFIKKTTLLHAKELIPKIQIVIVPCVNKIIIRYPYLKLAWNKIAMMYPVVFLNKTNVKI